jgi:hypothetical protein
MTTKDSPSSFPLVGLALLVIGVFGAIVAYRQCDGSQNRFVSVQSPRADRSSAEDSAEPAPGDLAAAAPAVAANTVSAGAGSPRSAASAAPTIEWESLVERAPEAALQRLKASVPRDDSEAQRYGVYEVRALTKLQRIGEARAKAETYFERWPSGPDIVYLQGLTGAHPTPKGDVGERP